MRPEWLEIRWMPALVGAVRVGYSKRFYIERAGPFCLGWICFRRHFLSCELVRHLERSRSWEHPDIARNSKRRRFGLSKASNKLVVQLAKELGVAAKSIRDWAKQAEADSGRGAPGVLTTPERDELGRPGPLGTLRDPNRT